MNNKANLLELHIILRSGRDVAIAFEATYEDTILTQQQWAEVFWRIIAEDDILYIDDIHNHPHAIPAHAIDYLTIKDYMPW